MAKGTCVCRCLGSRDSKGRDKVSKDKASRVRVSKVKDRAKVSRVKAKVRDRVSKASRAKDKVRAKDRVRAKAARRTVKVRDKAKDSRAKDRRSPFNPVAKAATRCSRSRAWAKTVKDKGKVRVKHRWGPAPATVTTR